MFIKRVPPVSGSRDSRLHEPATSLVLTMAILSSFIASNGGYWEEIKLGYFCQFMVL